jgi:hypothetical protein
MNIATEMEFDFKLVDEGIKEEWLERGVQENEVMEGEFFILEKGKNIGVVDVNTFNGIKYVSVNIPEVHFTVEEWISFMNQVKERFRLPSYQEIMVNVHPTSYAV